MAEEQNPIENPAALAEQLAKLIPPHLAAEAEKLAPALAALTVTRSSDYKTVYTNVFRTRISANEVTIVLSRITHRPGILIAGDVIEEQTEIVMAWPELKMFEKTIRSLVDAFEMEVGIIPISSSFQSNLEGHRQAVRTFGLSTAEREVSLTSDPEQIPSGEPANPPRKRQRRKSS
jgi:hypothetical protein